MAVDIKIPSAGESISEVQIGNWMKSEGDHVDAEEPIVEIETDKATMELPAPSAGTLIKVLKQPGESVSVGDVIGQIDESGNGQPPQKEAQREETESKEADEEQRREAEPTEETKQEEQRKEEQTQPAEVKEEPREEKTPPAKSRPERRDNEEEEYVLPAARRAMAERGLQPADVSGTGPGGRILKEDVERAAEHKQGGAPRRPPTAPPGGPSRVDGRAREEDTVPMTLLRKRVAARLVESQQSTAMLTTFNEVDMSGVIALRKQRGEMFKEQYGVKLGFMSFFVKAAIEALKHVPQVNAEVRDDSIVYKNYYDIGVAVSTERGLLVPVIRNADRLSFAQIEVTLGDLAKRAREKKITPDELQGGTFTISNGGVFGSLLSTPIINPPQSGILGLHAIQDRPVAVEGQVVVRPMMYVALTYDHRIVDGRESVTFLKRVKECVEDPARILLEV